MRQIVALFITTRFGLIATILVALASFSPAPTALTVSNVPLLNALAQWDGGAYLYIAEHGYRAESYTNYTAYFPLYPLLMKLAGSALGGSSDAHLVAGVLIANAATLIAVLALAQINTSKPIAAATYVLLFPTTVFLSAVYADALFLALAVTSALAAQRTWWWRSGALAAAAALTRPFGGLAVIPLIVTLYRAGRLTPQGVAAAVLAPAAFLAFVLYLYGVTGDPLAVLHGYSSGFAPRQPLQSITDLFDRSVYGVPWLIGGMFAVSVVLVALSWRLTAPPLAAFATALLLVIVFAGSLTSSARYELSLYPMFLALAAVLRPALSRVVWTLASASLAVLLAATFALGFWVG